MRGDVENSEQFLRALTKDLKERPDADIGLASILGDHILTEAPVSNAVTNAKAAIVALATERAQQLAHGAENE